METAFGQEVVEVDVEAMAICVARAVHGLSTAGRVGADAVTVMANTLAMAHVGCSDRYV